MSESWNERLRSVSLISVVFLALAMVGCEDGKDGDDGAAGPAGADGTDGVACWDLNENGVGDPEEDLNGDGVIDAVDCNALASGAYETQQLHAGYFAEHDYEGTQSCLNCHGLTGDDMLGNAHFTWEGVSANIEGYEGEIHGKNDLINNFCIAVPTNEGRCTQCHAGYGYDDDTFAFNDPKTVDCLVCHDQSGTYVKGLTTAGRPDPAVDLNVVARSVAANDGVPSRKNCIGCHANAGGGDNVKHGDLAMAMLDTTREFDVHMGTDGADFSCVACHGVKKDMDDKLVDHGIGGMPTHSIDDGNMKTCVDCHGDSANLHAGSPAQGMVNNHPTLACQVCHIPAFARDTSTKVEWYWADAGQDIDPIPVDPATGRPTYDKKKGTFIWANDVRPELLYFDGKWDRMMINVNDQYTSTPVNLGKPSADYATAGAMVYPFKKMIGNQVADANNNTMLVPHLFGLKGGPNPYWAKYDWDLALQDGAAYTGQTYSGNFEFVDTFMYLTVNHEVAPKEQALGVGGACDDCHTIDVIDWAGLGYTDDPFRGGTRPPIP
jgi:octaheme c-type cytochrome (tetrathionate reductase family)